MKPRGLEEDEVRWASNIYLRASLNFLCPYFYFYFLKKRPTGVIGAEPEAE